MSSLLSQVLLAQMTHVVLQVVAVLLWILVHLGLKAGDVRPHLPIKLHVIMHYHTGTATHTVQPRTESGKATAHTPQQDISSEQRHLRMK